MKIKMMDLWMQIEGKKLIFVMNFSVLDFFKFASKMPQIAQILVSTFNIFQGSMLPNLPRYFLFFFFNNTRLCFAYVHKHLCVWKRNVSQASLCVK